MFEFEKVFAAERNYLDCLANVKPHFLLCCFLPLCSASFQSFFCTLKYCSSSWHVFKDFFVATPSSFCSTCYIGWTTVTKSYMNFNKSMAAFLEQLKARSHLFAALISPSRVFTRCNNLPHGTSVTFKRSHSASEGWAHSHVFPGIFLHHHKLLFRFATSPGVPCLVP